MVKIGQKQGLFNFQIHQVCLFQEFTQKYFRHSLTKSIFSPTFFLVIENLQNFYLDSLSATVNCTHRSEYLS